MAIRPSLFAPADTSSLAAGSDWITSTLLGGAAVTLCVLAVAYVGLMLLTGRMVVIQAMRVVLGCFILLGAPVIAGAFMGFGQSANTAPPPVPIVPAEPPRADLPPADYDPYAGASLRQD